MSTTSELEDFGCTKNELVEAVHAGANRDDVARIESAVWRLFDRVSGLRYFMDARNSLLAEVENEKRQNRAAAARLSELERENAALREALKPFAKSSERDWDEDAEDDTEIWSSQGPGWNVSRDCYTVGDLRRARAALAGSGEK